MVSTVKTREKINQLASERILILDGAMGSQIQAYRTPEGKELEEDDFRGVRFKNFPGGAKLSGERKIPVSLKGCNDLLCITKPDVIIGIHKAYLEAGADIIETCSLNANAISLKDQGLESFSYEINVAAAGIARKTADAFSTPQKPRFVAGSIGPTPKSASICPNLDEPNKKAVTWDELEAAYYDNSRGLVDGGADLLIIETMFDTLNVKAAIFAIRRLARERGIDIPIIVSATVSDGGRLLSGQTTEAFCVSVLHGDPLAVGLNCSFGAEKLKPYVAAVSAAVPCLVSAYPNAGLPGRGGTYDESPESMADKIEAYMKEGLVNIIGGCCGSTPAHIALIAERAKKYAPRTIPKAGKKSHTHQEKECIMLSGLETQEINFETIRAEKEKQRKSPYRDELLKFLEEEDYDSAVEHIRDLADEGALIIDISLDELSNAKTAVTSFLNLALQFPDIARLPMMIESSDSDLITAVLKCIQGRSLVKLPARIGSSESGQIREYGAELLT